MKKIFFPLLFSLFTHFTIAQTDSSKIQLGDSVFFFKKFCNPSINNNYVFINVHSNEVTSQLVTIDFSKNNNTCFYALFNSQKRNVKFNVGKKLYEVDPNRIFTPKGRKATLKKNSTYNKKAELITKIMADTILTKISSYKLVVAMHNNTNNEYSIKSYMKDSSEAANTAELYINPSNDCDDFVYTTVPKIYQFLKDKKINVVLQKSNGFVDDGSLSSYCTSKKIDYLNIEAEHSHKAEQLRMLNIIQEILLWYQ